MEDYRAEFHLIEFQPYDASIPSDLRPPRVCCCTYNLLAFPTVVSRLRLRLVHLPVLSHPISYFAIECFISTQLTNSHQASSCSHPNHPSTDYFLSIYASPILSIHFTLRPPAPCIAPPFASSASSPFLLPASSVRIFGIPGTLVCFRPGFCSHFTNHHI